MPPQNLPLSSHAQRLLSVAKDELFPQLNRLKEILVESQKIRIHAHLYSKKLRAIDLEYSSILPDFFSVVQRLETPDLLFEGLEDNPQGIAQYMQFIPAVKNNIGEGIGFIEIIDRTLDRKSQQIQSNRTLIVSLSALVIGILSILGNFHPDTSQAEKGAVSNPAVAKPLSN